MDSTADVLTVAAASMIAGFILASVYWNDVCKGLSKLVDSVLEQNERFAHRIDELQYNDDNWWKGDD